MMKNILRFFSKSHKSQSRHMEDIFEGDSNKYLSRHIVLNKIKNLDGNGIAYTSDKFVHVIIIGSDNFSMHIARQAAIMCHYPNFNDKTEANRSIITIIEPQSVGKDDVEKMKNRFAKVTGNLLAEALWSCRYYGEKTEEWQSPKEKSFIDIKFEFVGLQEGSTDKFIAQNTAQNSNAIVSILDNTNTLSCESISLIKEHCHQYYKVEETELAKNIQDYRVNTRRAQITNMLYNAGTHLKNICISSLYEIEKYNTSLKVFCHNTSDNKTERLWNEIKKQEIKLSNLHCADYAETRKRSMDALKGEGKEMPDAKNLEHLSNAEHARWNVEKLIYGYRPYTAEERYKDECLFIDNAKLKAERARMKNEQKAHIDICSCNELKRTDYDNIKYDCFIVLANNEILSIK